MVDPDRSNPTAPEPGRRGTETLGLNPFQGEIDDQGISLEELGKTYAQLIGKGQDPYDADPSAGPVAGPVADGAAESPARDASASEPPSDRSDEAPTAESVDRFLTEEPECSSDPPQEPDVELCPRSILEAILFVGHPTSEPICATDIADLMRGVPAREIEELIDQLNDHYTQFDHPFHIVARESGFRLELRSEFAALRDVFYGKIREARLSQAAIDVLAIVAYQQGCSKDEIDQRRGRSSGSLLSQLVRRQLLRIERPQTKPRRPRYFTTDRFLSLFRLETLDDLPTAQDLD